ncbi:DUF1764-domain-containing protein [Favolaschia claudopus]|uniref:DUF1764-domain-containing protein n=1 Tax=Favolaschia claudopus TaxID=2862362 RepID=A0AAW0EI14_9AGAR
MSEIDDIFAKRPVASTSAIPSASKKKQKPKEKPAATVPDKSIPVTSSKKRPAPETVVDSSSRPPPKKPRAEKPKAVAAPVDKEATERFKDSRGFGPRRKTEEGWSIYKEDELGISHDGGDTPLCPFDCDCCF